MDDNYFQVHTTQGSVFEGYCYSVQGGIVMMNATMIRRMGTFTEEARIDPLQIDINDIVGTVRRDFTGNESVASSDDITERENQINESRIIGDDNSKREHGGSSYSQYARFHSLAASIEMVPPQGSSFGERSQVTGQPYTQYEWQRSCSVAPDGTTIPPSSQVNQHQGFVHGVAAIPQMPAPHPQVNQYQGNVRGRATISPVCPQIGSGNKHQGFVLGGGANPRWNQNLLWI